ncbi:VWA domain-containing protein [Flammeovirga kamogawensis]|uniref:VWA domain-containing protein n=1 Tax=Flammeovirga kamogawensis TaxID=373891 RepID=A0ABX8GS09_9BACT|nr:VWA domain-containing protein [Flammeovirga kamogawensis]MBB6461466.1 Ca-activated chloride channel family protein [Flammeovirga kamogawensis]QWG06360.1 VWA domain-containing protein [Flammeovirga kamogawensis]TRX68188.1 VWA domain-containing protein [Flammeovirga kamogawensis]
MYEIAYPWMFFLLPLPLLVWWLIPAFKQKKDALYYPKFDELTQATGLKPQKSATILKRRWFQYVINFIIWVCIVAAMSNPQYIGKPAKKVKNARNMLVAADISMSMNTKDWHDKDGNRISRWKAVQNVLNEFIEKREGDRIGLMLFGSDVFALPFTPDLDIIKHTIDETGIGMAGHKTAIGNAIALSTQVFEADSIKQKVMILLTDGQDSGSEIVPITASNMAADDSIKIYTIGIGTKESSQYELDDKTLTKIAKNTGGEYFNAGNLEELNTIYDKLNEMEPIQFEDEGYRPTRLLFYIPLEVGLGIALVFQFLSIAVNFIGSLKRKKS